jgi:alpha-N-arabinofuranosidase
MVFLGIRDKPGMFPRVHNLGRETCLAPVRWTDTGWPVVGEDGHVGLTVDAQAYGEQDTNYIDTETDFAELGHEWNFLRNPDPATWSLEPEGLRLHGNASTLSDREAKAFVGRRQQHDRFEATTTLDFEPERVGDEAGLTVRMNETHHYELALVAEPTGRSLILRRTIGDLSAVTARLRAPGRHLEIGVRGDQERYTFYFSTEHGGDLVVGTGAARHLSTEVAGGFTGVYIGLYASGNGASCDAPAFFSRFGYRGRESPIASTK